MKFSTLALVAVVFASTANGFTGPMVTPRFAVQVRENFREKRFSGSSGTVTCHRSNQWLFDANILACWCPEFSVALNILRLPTVLEWLLGVARRHYLLVRRYSVKDFTVPHSHPP